MKERKLTKKNQYMLLTALLAFSLLVFGISLLAYSGLGEKSDIQVDKGVYAPDSRNISTALGDFNPRNFAMSDEEIIWEGVHTARQPNETVKYNGTLIAEGSVTNIEPWNYSANNYGLRGDHIWEKESEIRVLVVGSSLTMGQAVSYSDTYTKKLEDSLNREYNRTFDVINAGIDHAGMIDHYIFLASLSDDIEPDLVLISDLGAGSVISRAERIQISRNIDKRIQKRREKSNKTDQIRLIGGIGNRIESEYISMTMEDYYHSEATEYLRRTEDLMEKDGVEVKVFCIQGCRGWVSSTARDEGMHVVEGPKELAGRLNEEKYAYKDGHLKPRGHDLAANKLYDAINWSRYS